MLKINIGLSRKLTQDYNSQGFSLNIEGELPSDVLHDEKVLAQSTNRLFQLANLMLDDQIEKARGRAVATATVDRPVRQVTTAAANGRNGHSTNGQNGNGRNAHGSVGATNSVERLLTQAQARAIQNMARKLNLEPNRWARDEFGTNRVEDLTVKQASEAISVLKEQLDGSTKGGRR